MRLGPAHYCAEAAKQLPFCRTMEWCLWSSVTSAACSFADISSSDGCVRAWHIGLHLWSMAHGTPWCELLCSDGCLFRQTSLRVREKHLQESVCSPDSGDQKNAAPDQQNQQQENCLILCERMFKHVRGSSARETGTCAHQGGYSTTASPWVSLPLATTAKGLLPTRAGGSGGVRPTMKSRGSSRTSPTRSSYLLVRLQLPRRAVVWTDVPVPKVWGPIEFLCYLVVKNLEG